MEKATSVKTTFGTDKSGFAKRLFAAIKAKKIESTDFLITLYSSSYKDNPLL